MSDAEHAARVNRVQAELRARLRDELLATPWVPVTGLADPADADRLLVVPHAGSEVVPAFQLTDDHTPRPELLPVLDALRAGGTDPWQAWGWLTRPAALLGGQVPEELVRDPDEADLVLHAAVRLAERGP